jgi:HlyD family secretion protein
MRLRQVLVLSGLFLLAVLLIVFPPDQEVALREPVPAPVRVTAVERADLRPVETVSGHLQPARRVTLQFEVAGRVATRTAEPGMEVAEGDVLLTLEDGDYRDALTQARAEWQTERDGLERDRRLLQLARRSRVLQEEEVERLQSLSERSLASKSLIGDAEALLATRQAEEARLRSSVATGPQRVAARKAALDRAQRNLDRTALRAPFAGRVNQVFVQAGDYALVNQSAVEFIDSALDFYAEVRGEVARSLEFGQTVDVDVEGVVSQATLVAVQPDPDPATFTHAVRLRMPAGETRAGASARARLPLRTLRQVLVVPATAVLNDGASAYVFRVAQGRLQRLAVQLGPRVGERQVILDGVAEGDRVVTRDVAALADGQNVTPDADPS